MKFKKNIVFVGDSYCSSACTSLNYDTNIADSIGQQRDNHPDHISWLDHVAERLNLNLYGFGYAGRSWYYSRVKFFEYLLDDPSWAEQIEFLVFCHTENSRYNTANGDIHNGLMIPEYRRMPGNPPSGPKEILATALQYWFTDLLDYPYQDWAQQQWFYEIARTFGHIKQIHFNNYPWSIKDTTDILPGVIFTTPLLHLSLSEASGTDEDITTNYMINDQRVNHFNSHNNRALGELVVTTAQNYQPGHYSIDASKFDIVNPNASRWPNPGFGTR
jgi:hypothetical protein